ncbi:MAG: hypothetical protein ACTHV8_05620 [Nesterenkonia sp.]
MDEDAASVAIGIVENLVFQVEFAQIGVNDLFGTSYAAMRRLFDPTA